MNGTNYYRIVQYDFDQQSTKSQTIAIEFNSIETIQVNPNPSKDFFTVRITNPTDAATIHILDLLGRKLSSVYISSESNEINIGEDLGKGSYLLQYVSKSGIQYLKIVKE